VGLGSTPGVLRYNTDSSKVELYDGSQWAEVQSSRPDLNGGARGLFAGGYTSFPVGSTTNAIEYITISSTGNSVDFGDLSNARQDAHSCASSTRGLFAASSDNRIDYVTIASTGNSQDFADVTTTNKSYSSATGNSTRGLWGAGRTPTIGNTIDYVTIASQGINAQDFGDTTVARAGVAACSSSTRGVFGGGYISPAQIGQTNVIDFITISTLGNALDFGDLTQARHFLTACSNATRGLFGGGVTPTKVNTIDYLTIATLGNAVKFGDLTLVRGEAPAGCSSPTRGVFGGGFSPTPTSLDSNIIDYVTISTQSNAVDFGDLAQSTATRIKGACSNAHGGL